MGTHDRERGARADAIASIEKKLPKEFPESVYAAIAKGIGRHAKEFLAGLKHLQV